MSGFTNLLISLSNWSEKREPLTSTEEVSNTFCPFAFGVNNNGFICPSSDILCGNAAASQWTDFIQFYDCSHLSYWLKVCAEYKPDTFVHLALESKPYGVHEHLIPFARYVPFPEQVLFRQGTVFEVMGEMEILMIHQLRTYLYGLITLGIFLNDQLADTVYMIQNPGEYIAARTFGGVLDRGVLIGSSRTGFLPAFGGDQSVYNSDPMYQSLQGESIDPETFNRLILNEKTRLANSTFLGGETDIVLAMKEALKLPESYTDYLSKRGPIDQEKVGPKVFESIVLAQSSKAKLRHNRPDRVDAQTKLTAPPPAGFQGPSVSVDEWLNGGVKSTLPFGGTETFNMFSMTGTGNSSTATSAVSDPNTTTCVIC